jgi:predicted O-linked N-acetylglucosamine transferase (SPINDLY family)
MSVEQAMQLAVQRHRDGQLSEADSLYRQILTERPDHPDALHLMGVLASQAGRHDVAVQLIGRAIAINAGSAAYFINLGVALAELGRLDEAVAAYRRGLMINPNDPLALSSLANALRQKGDAHEAIAACRRALAIRPDCAQAHNNLGSALMLLGSWNEAAAEFRAAVALDAKSPEAHANLGAALLQRGSLDQAIASFAMAIELRPNFADAYSNLGLAQMMAGDLDASIASMEKAISLRPNLVQAIYNLGQALAKKGELEKALDCYQKTLAQQPRVRELYNNMGLVLRDLGRVEQAAAAFQEAVKLDPTSAAAWNNLSSVYAETARLDQAVEASRRALAICPWMVEALTNLGGQLFARGELDEAIAYHDKALAIKPDAAIASNRLFILQYHPDCNPAMLLHEHRVWDRQYAQPLRPAHPPGKDAGAGRRLRIGYVSGDLRNHVVGWNLLPLLREHDHERFEIVCYSNTTERDAQTERIRQCGDQWRDISRLDDQRCAEMIRGDRIDILVDLSLHMAHNRMLVFARRPAPVQMTYLGYAGTTGLEAIQYRFSDPYLDPVDADASCYSEKTIRLPRTYWCYQPGGATPEVSESPAMKNRYVTFGCLSNFGKVSAAALDAWGHIMSEVPRSRLLLCCPAGVARERVAERLAGRGIHSTRLEFVDRQSWSGYIATYSRIDIGLDPFPYCGGITTCDSLWMGVPVVSLRGRNAVGRAGGTILSNIGLGELVADSIDEYVRLAKECERWIPLRPGLRRRMSDSPLMNAKQFARDVEMAYERIWNCGAGK